jgi:hypothetical protein
MRRIFAVLMFASLLCGCYTRFHSEPLHRDTTDVTHEPISMKIDSTTYTEISMSGGGFYGDANPVTGRRFEIRNNGESIYWTRQLYTGEREKRHFISRSEIENLALFIIEKGFFQMRDHYDCSDYNRDCERRKHHYPPAVPLTLTIRIGEHAKTVTVSVFEKGMIDYPQGLEEIAKRVSDIVSVSIGN